jgi:hypothetical protein
LRKLAHDAHDPLRRVKKPRPDGPAGVAGQLHCGLARGSDNPLPVTKDRTTQATCVEELNGALGALTALELLLAKVR